MRDDAPYGLDDPKNDSDEGPIRARVALPAILLILVSVLNVLGGIYLMFNAVLIKSGRADAQISKQWDGMDENSRKEAENAGWTEANFFEFAKTTANVFLGWGTFSALVAALTLLGARRMRSLHSYGLAMTAAVLTAIPCVTPCCLIGQIAGIWAVIVLMNPDVRKAFH